MAITSTGSTNLGDSQTQAPTVDMGTTQTNAASTAKQELKAPTITEVLAILQPPTALSPVGREFVNSLNDKFKNDSYSANKIKIINLNYPAEGLCFIHDGYCVGIMFAESIDIADDKFIGSYIPLMIKHIKAQIENVKLLNVVQIGSEDYKRVDQYFTYIKNTLICASNSTIDEVNVETFQSTRWGVDVSTSAYTNYIKRVSPHEIAPRDDIGFLLSAETKNKDLSWFNFSRSDQFESQPVAAVTGYVDINLVQNNQFQGGTKFMPLIHVTDIQTHMPKSNILGAVIPIMADVFLYNGLWKAPFQQIGKGLPNIGFLVKDEQNQPAQITNPAQLNAFMQQFFVAPMLCIDIAEGRARIPGIERFAIAEQGYQIVKENLFFLNDPSYRNLEKNTGIGPTQATFYEILGDINIGKDIVDSRWVDFLRTVRDMPAEYDNLYELLTRNIDPKLRMIKQRDIHSNFKAKYINHCCILKGDYVVNLLNQIRSKLNVQSNLTGAQAGAIDTTGFLNNATSYYNGFTGGFTNGVMPGMDISYMNQYNAGRFY